MLAVGARGGCLDIFSLVYHFSFLSPFLWETARYRLKYCLKGPLSPRTTNQPSNVLLTYAQVVMVQGTSTKVCHFSFLSPFLWETARYRLKYCLKGPLSPRTTNQPSNFLLTYAQVVMVQGTSTKVCSKVSGESTQIESPNS